MGKFEINGLYRGGINGKTWLPFSKVVESQNDRFAMEKVYSRMGSEHGLKRDFIRINEVKAIE